MSRRDADKDLEFRTEGANVRAVATDLDILFPRSEKKDVQRAYDEWRPQTLADFEPRWKAHAGANLERAAFEAILREVTLHWIGYSVMHREPVHMGVAQWDHPQTRRIIRKVVQRDFAPGSDEAAALCAQLMGTTRQAYLAWAEADESFLGIT